MKRCTKQHTESVCAWLENHHAERIRTLLHQHSKDMTAKLLREELHAKGVKYANGVYLSRAQIRQALTRFHRPPVAERMTPVSLDTP